MSQLTPDILAAFELPKQFETVFGLSTTARANQRVRRAVWMVGEGLSASETAAIPLDFNPTPEHITRE